MIWLNGTRSSGGIGLGRSAFWNQGYCSTRLNRRWNAALNSAIDSLV